MIPDLGLPDKDGATLLCQWRRRGVENPVLILTARDAIEDRINGLDSGADDYLVKPFALAELQARVRALIRRYQGHSDNLLTDGDITLNLQTQQVLRQSQPVEVTPKEFALLTRLIMRSGQTVHRETLQQDIYSGRTIRDQTRLKFIFIICAASSVKIASKPYAAWVTVWRARNEQYAPAINGVAGGYSAIFQLISVVWLWHESREQIGFLVNETLSAKARNNHVEKEIREAIASLLVPSLVMVGFTLLFSFWAVTWITRPLNKLRASLANRSADNLTPLPMYSDMEEIGAVTTSLNQLLARLDHTIQQERLFTADAAHELRTPLAGIRLHLELMAQSGSPQATPLINRIDQLMHTVEQLLMLARAGQAMASGHYDTVNWTESIIAPLSPEHEAKEHTVLWPAHSTLTVQGTPSCYV